MLEALLREQLSKQVDADRHKAIAHRAAVVEILVRAGLTTDEEYHRLVAKHEAALDQYLAAKREAANDVS